MANNKTASLVLAICSILLYATATHAATGCSYPKSLDSYVDKIANDFLTVADVNKIMCSIEKTQAELGTLPKGNYASVASRLNSLVDSAGKSGGQSIVGGTQAGDDLTLSSTSNASKDRIFFGAAGAFDEANRRLGIGTIAPNAKIEINESGADSLVLIYAAGTAVTTGLKGQRARGTVLSPAAVQTGDEIVRLSGQGYDSAAVQEAGVIRIIATENWSTNTKGSAIEFYGNGAASGPNGGTNLIRIASLIPSDGLYLDDLSARIVLNETTVTASCPAAGAAARLYMKSDKLVVQYNDAGTCRYKYLDLTGTGATWVHTTTAP
jgi:hypothetical protein